MTKHYFTHAVCEEAAASLAEDLFMLYRAEDCVKLYGVPRGGVPAAYLVSAVMKEWDFPHKIVETPEEADVFVDDLIDSGATMAKFKKHFPKKQFVALYNKAPGDPWVVFPWEGTLEESGSDFTTRLLQFIGEDPTRGGLIETPARVAKAWKFWSRGYDEDPKTILKVFEDGGEDYDQMVLVRDIPVYSHCEHHLAAIFGTASVAYIPDGKICGLSKLNRIVDAFARRLQVQERLTHQVAESIDSVLSPKGVAVQLRCRHLCMESRGVCQQGHTTVTTALRGVFKDDVSAKEEFLHQCAV